MERCSTVRIKATTGSYPFTTINESDFDPSKYELYVEEGDAEAEAKAAEAEKLAKAIAQEAAAKQNALDAAAKLNKADLLTHLTELGVDHDASMTKTELLALLA